MGKRLVSQKYFHVMEVVIDGGLSYVVWNRVVKFLGIKEKWVYSREFYISSLEALRLLKK